MKLVFALLILSCSAFASTRFTTFDRQGPIPSSSCGLAASICGSNTGSRGQLNACQVRCYHGQNAVCIPGSFGDQTGPNGCEVVQDNSCYCE